MKKYILLLFVAVGCPLIANAQNADYCSEIGRWAEGMAYSTLKNNTEIKPEDIEYDRTEIKRLAQEKIGDDLFRQVHHIRYYTKTGNMIETITVNDASSVECSMTPVDVYLIKKAYFSSKE